MADKFANINDLGSQCRAALAVTPSDSVDLTDVPKALYIGVGGNISVDPVDGPGTAVIFPVVAGQVFDFVRVKRVRATGTTATSIVGGY